jgi:hypothetical protein
MSTFARSRRNELTGNESIPLLGKDESTVNMLGRDYLVRQVTTLLRMAKTTRDPQVSAGLAVKAADLKARLDDTPPPPDAPPIVPDTESHK